MGKETRNNQPRHSASAVRLGSPLSRASFSLLCVCFYEVRAQVISYSVPTQTVGALIDIELPIKACMLIDLLARGIAPPSPVSDMPRGQSLLQAYKQAAYLGMYTQTEGIPKKNGILLTTADLGTVVGWPAQSQYGQKAP